MNRPKGRLYSGALGDPNAVSVGVPARVLAEAARRAVEHEERMSAWRGRGPMLGKLAALVDVLGVDMGTLEGRLTVAVAWSALDERPGGWVKVFVARKRKDKKAMDSGKGVDAVVDGRFGGAR